MPPAPSRCSSPGRPQRARRAGGPRTDDAARASRWTLARAQAAKDRGAIGRVGSRHGGDAEHTPAVIVRNVERAVASDEHVDRAVPYPVARTPTRREVLESWSPVRGQDDPHDLVAGGGKLGPGAMEGDEEAPTIRGRKLRSRIKGEPERCRVRSELDRGEREVAAVARAAKLGIGRGGDLPPDKDRTTSRSRRRAGRPGRRRSTVSSGARPPEGRG